MMMSFLSEVYGIEPFDYGRLNSRSILIAAGTGLMLSVMDQCPSIRWCLDVDILTQAQRANLANWLTCVGNVTERVIVAGWFSSTNPRPLASAVARLRRSRLTCYVQFHGVGEDPFRDLRTAETLAQLLEQVRGSSPPI